MKRTSVFALVLAIFGGVLVAGTTSVQAAEESHLTVYGFAMMDAIYDFNTMDPSWNAALRPSKIPVNCPPTGNDPGCGKDGETIFSVRQSRLGVKGAFPTSAGELRTKFEFDMFGVGPDAGKTTIRLRHAYGEIGPFLAGQTNSLFMDGDVFPNTIEYWGPVGMVFFRNIQARWTFLNHDGTKAAVALEAPGSAVDSGNLVIVDPSFTSVQGYTKYPDLTGQFRMDQSWGHAQASGILRWLGWETPANPDSEPSDNVIGYGVNLAGGLKTVGKDQLLVQVAYGKGIASYMNDCCVDVAPDAPVPTDGEAVPLLAWLVYYDHYWSEKWSSSIGYSATDQDNTDGQTNTAMAKGAYASGNLLYYPVQNVMVGGELIWGQRENKDGANASDTRFQFSAKYSF